MLEENYNKNQRFILGINTLWLFYPLLCITELNIYIYLLGFHAICVIFVSLLFWFFNKNVLYIIDLNLALTFVIHILFYKNNNLYHYLMILLSIILLKLTNEFKKRKQFEYSLITHLLFRKIICLVFYLKITKHNIIECVILSFLYFIYIFYLLLCNKIIYIYHCIELLILQVLFKIYIIRTITV
mgnify:CR=1 FL=1